MSEGESTLLDLLNHLSQALREVVLGIFRTVAFTKNSYQSKRRNHTGGSTNHYHLNQALKEAALGMFRMVAVDVS